jgi:hypothetical protein
MCAKSECGNYVVGEWMCVKGAGNNKFSAEAAVMYTQMCGEECRENVRAQDER